MQRCELPDMVESCRCHWREKGRESTQRTAGHLHQWEEHLLCWSGDHLRQRGRNLHRLAAASKVFHPADSRSASSTGGTSTKRNSRLSTTRNFVDSGASIRWISSTVERRASKRTRFYELLIIQIQDTSSSSWYSLNSRVQVETSWSHVGLGSSGLNFCDG